MCRDGYIYPLYDVTKDYDYPCPGEGPFYTDYYYHARTSRTDIGLDKCGWNEKYTYLISHKYELCNLFNERYDYRELGQETYVRFQNFLNRKLHEIEEKFDHAFKMYEENDVDDLGIGYEEEETYNRTGKTTESASSNTTGNSKFKDTPTSVAGINNPTTETDNEGTTEGNSETEEQDNYIRSHKKTQHDQHTITEVNTNINVYRNLMNEFVLAFEPCFMQLLQ